MVAVVAGNGLGLFNTSLNTVGNSALLGLGALGQAGGRSYVNAATGNLVLQFQDEQLSGRGLDLLHLRTYNSRGTWSDGDADGWRWDGERSLKLNTVDNTLTRTGGDGHETVYRWNGSRYVSPEGSGAHDSIVYNGVDFVWTDGSSRMQEAYAGSSKRLKSQTDSSGNSINFGYDGSGRLNAVTDVGSSQQLVLTYGPTVPGGSLIRLQKIETKSVTVDAQGRWTVGSPLKQVDYGYDGIGRLTSVKTDLTPTIATDNTDATKIYTTTYTYDTNTPTSKRIASVSQSDGSGVNFTYDTSDRVTSVTDANGLQTFTYGTNSTNVKIDDGTTDGQVWTYTYDAVTQQLTRIDTPAPTVGAERLSTQFHYDASGNVDKVTDARGKEMVYEYDPQGNRTLERDALGGTVTRTYDSKNQLVTETRYKTPDPDAAGARAASEPVTARFVYDAQARLRFVVSAEGRVTENRYGTATTGYGLLTRSLQYAGGRYDVSALVPTDELTEAQLSTWLTSQDKKQVQQTSFEYDYRGNLSKRTDFAATGADGNGVLDAAATVSEYTYSAHGELLQTIAVRGSARDQRTQLSSMTYDGMGRGLSAVGSNGTITTLYDGANRKIQVTNTKTGLAETRSFDTRGRLLSVSQSAGNASRETQYVYDTAGRLRMVGDAQGGRRFSFYDATGRLQYQVDSTGAVTGYVYNANGQVTSETRYAKRASTAAWVTLDNTTTPATVTAVTKSSLTVGASGSDVEADASHDRVTAYAYDNAGRLTTKTDAANVQTQTTYDGLSRVTVQQTGDQVTRYFYDRDGRQVGVVDPLGYLTESKFDAAGRLTETVRYSTRSPSSVNTSAPVWVGVTNQSATGGRPFEYRMPAAYDADGDALTYSVAGTKPGWLSFDAASLTLSGTAPTGLTSYDITLRASDARGATPKTTDVTVRVTVVNSAPSWGELPDSTVAANATGYSLILPQASDVESTAAQLKYAIVDPALLPPGLTFDAATRKLSGVPTTPGLYVIKVRVTDAQSPALSTERSFTLEVTNNGPRWTATPTPPAAWINTAFSYTVPAATDPEGQALTYRVVSKPVWLEFNAATRELSGTPTQLGPQAVVLEAQDPLGETVRLSFSLNVGNRAPTWAALTAPPPVQAGSPLDYTPLTAVDPEGQTLTYSGVSGLPLGLTVNSTNGRITGTTNEVGAFTVVLRATDPYGESTERSVVLQLNNAAPVYNRGIANQTVQAYRHVGADVYIVIPADAFIDPNGDALSPLGAWGMPSWLTFDPQTRTFSGHTVNADSSSAITVAVSDSRGANASRSFVLTVTAEAAPPPPGTDPQFAGLQPGKSENAAPTALVLASVEDVLAAWRPTGNADDLHGYQYYDGQGRVVGSVDERGFLSETVYDAQANKQQTLRYMTAVAVTASDTLETVRSLAGTNKQTTTIEYDGFGRVDKRTDVDGTVSSNEYDDAGRLVREVRAGGTTELRASRIRYNAFGEVTGTLGGVGDAELVRTPALGLDGAIADYGMRYEYDSLGRRVKAIDANNNVSLFYYDSESRLSHSVNAKGEVSETAYNRFGQAESVRRYGTRFTPEVLATLTTGGLADSAFLSKVAALADASKDQITSNEYDQRGLLVKQTDGLGFVTTNTYTAFGQLAKQERTIATGKTVTTQFGYDLRGKLLAQTGDAGGINFNGRMEYDAFGRVVRSVDGAGKITQTNYKDSGRAIEVTDPLTRTMRSEYDAFGRVLKQIDALNQSTTYAYDDVARTVSVTTPEGVTVSTTKTRHGQTLNVVDGRNNTTAYEYDKAGQLTQVTDALGHVVSQNTYDKSGRVSETRDARGIVTTLSYDALNRVVTRAVDPTTTTPAHTGLNLQTQYKFDELGQQFKVTEGLGSSAQRVTKYLYDRLGQLTQMIIDPEGLKLSTRYSFDGIGNTVKVERGTVDSPSDQVTLYVFDNLGRRVKEIAAPSAVFGAGSARTRDLTTEYRYDAAGRVSRVIDANGQSTWYVYDAAGQRTHTINALGEVGQTWYDANGRVVQSRQYLTRLTDSDLGGLGDVVGSVAVTADAADRRSYVVYDNDGRQRYGLQAAVGSTWVISESIYDANGNVTETRRYDKDLDEARLTAIDTTTSPGITAAEVKAELTTRGYSDAENTLTKIQRTRFAYDADNRLRFTVDALGSVSESVYDNAGHVLSSVRYATRPTLATFTESAINTAVNRANANNQVSQFAYDAAGRLRYSVQVLASDATGKATQHLVSRQEYDALGRVVQSTTYATVVGTLDDYTSPTLDDKVTLSVQDRRSAIVYDAAGRQIYSVQVLASDTNLVSKQEYDALGRVVKSTAYATAVGELASYTQATLDAAVSPNAQDRTMAVVYDVAGRQRFVIGPDGALSETVYDALGRVSETRQFDLRVSATTERTEAALSARRAGRMVGDGVTRGEKYTYDRAGRVLTTTDAKGFVETHAYNALGDKLSYTNKNADKWSYAYDRLGRLSSQVAPKVLMQLSNQTVPTEQSLETRIKYDAFGNVTERREAYNTADVRLTKYVYDRLGRQEQTVEPGWYDPTTGRVEKATATGRFQRGTYVTYDALGNAVRNAVRTGAGASALLYQYKTYDVLGRVVHDIDALNNVTAFTYNRFGEQETVTRYSVDVGVPPAGNNGAWTAADIASKVSTDALARTITTRYDNLGRKTEVTQPTVASYFYSSSEAAVNAGTVTPVEAAATTRYEYNAFGEVHHEAVKIDASRWRDSWHYFDVMGRETRSVDALGHHTARSYDALGNLTEVAEYANEGGTGSSGDFTPPNSPTESTEDRITAFAYNALNQQTEIQRMGLRYTSWNGSSYVAVNNARHVATTVQRTTYDGVGKVRTQTDGLGNVTTTEYNALGQITKVTEPARQTAAAGAVDPFRSQVDTASPVTTLTLDGFGRIIMQTRSAGGGLGATLTTLQSYDVAGNSLSSTDANGNVKYRQYDYAGRVTKETQAISTTLGSWKTNNHTLERRYAYDAAGRQVAAVDVYLVGTVAQQSGQRSVYNTFGEVTAERRVWGAASTAPGSLNSALVASYGYDNAGHVLTKTANDGETRYYYNLDGQVTRQEQRGNNSTADGTSTRVMETHFDLLGRADIQRLPSFSAIRTALGDSAEAITPFTTQLYDRWGNVVQSRKGGYVLNASNSAILGDEQLTRYTYNADNKVTAEHLPRVSAARTDGTSYRADVTHEIGYDLLSRAVQEIDRTDNAATTDDEATVLRTRSKQYNAVGQLVAETDGTNITSGITTEYAYDAHGNRVGTRNALGTVFVDTFDKNGNVLSHSVLRPYDSRNPTHTPVAVTLNEYQYDQANRRVVSAEFVREVAKSSYTQLDERNLILATRNPSGIQLTYGYDEFGNRISELDANRKGNSWSYVKTDYKIGQLDTATVAANRTTTYTYNDFGQLALEEYSYQTGDRKLDYHENGLLKKIIDETTKGTEGATGGMDYLRTVETRQYGYSAKGERAKESFDSQRWYDVGRYEYTPAEPGTPARYVLIGVDVNLVTTNRATRTSYDALGRVEQVDAPADQNPDRAELSLLTYKYDELSNRRAIEASYKLDASQSTLTSSKWYAYDGEGRMTRVDGRLDNGQIKDGIVITYDTQGRRATSERWLKASTYVNDFTNGKHDLPDEEDGVTITWTEFREERYGYNDMGLLANTEQRINRRNGTRNSTTPNLSDEQGQWYSYEARSYDTRGYMISSTKCTEVFSTGPESVSTPELRTTTLSAYLDDGRQSWQSTTDTLDSKNNTTIDHYTYDLAGILKSYQYKQGEGGSTVDNFNNTYTYTYNTDFGGYKESLVEVTTTRPGFSTAYTRSDYNGLGQLSSQEVQEGGSITARTFTYDGEGHILTKGEQIRTGTNGPGPSKWQDYIYSAGREVANIGTLMAAQFSNGYTPISAAYPSATPGSYVVSVGDSLASIAQAVFGDSQLWYLIADANSVSAGPTDALPSTELGRTYRIPNVVGNVHNNADTFRPYNPASIIGNTNPSPGLPVPPQPQCDTAGRVIATALMAAVAIAVTAYTGGAAAGVLGSSLLGSVAAAGVGAAAGSAASQLTGMALRVQDEFSGRQVLAAGISASLGALASGITQAVQRGQEAQGIYSAFSDTAENLISTAQNGLFRMAANSIAGVDYSLKSSLIDMGTSLGIAATYGDAFQALNTKNFKWGSSLQQVAASALNPQTGPVFSRSSRSSSWADIAQESVSAFASAGFSGARSRWITDSRSISSTASGYANARASLNSMNSVDQEFQLSTEFTEADYVGIRSDMRSAERLAFDQGLQLSTEFTEADYVGIRSDMRSAERLARQAQHAAAAKRNKATPETVLGRILEVAKHKALAASIEAEFAGLTENFRANSQEVVSDIANLDIVINTSITGPAAASKNPLGNGRRDIVDLLEKEFSGKQSWEGIFSPTKFESKLKESPLGYHPIESLGQVGINGLVGWAVISVSDPGGDGVLYDLYSREGKKVGTSGIPGPAGAMDSLQPGDFIGPALAPRIIRAAILKTGVAVARAATRIPTVVGQAALGRIRATGLVQDAEAMIAGRLPAGAVVSEVPYLANNALGVTGFGRSIEVLPQATIDGIGGAGYYAATVRHEAFHAWLTPKLESIATVPRYKLGMWAYHRSHLLRGGEEFLAQSYGLKSFSGGWSWIKSKSVTTQYGNLSGFRVAAEAGIYAGGVGGLAYGAHRLARPSR
jgi:YD repeat-containing protein